MQNIEGRVAFVTGGASGMGLGIAKALARAGAKVAIADVRDDHLVAAREDCAALGLEVAGYHLDVMDREQYRTVAEAVERDLGPVSILCLNAGIGVLGHIKDASYADWDWIMGVNLGGVINGVRTFLPAMRARGEGGHVMATSSLGGIVVAQSGGIYSAAKSGAVTMMECLREDLEKDGIGVSVLCPAAVNTNIHEHYDMRPDAFDGTTYSLAPEEREGLKAMLRQGMSPDEVGAIVVRGIRENELYLFTSGAGRQVIEDRRDALLASLPDEPKNEARWQADLAARRMMTERLA